MLRRHHRTALLLGLVAAVPRLVGLGATSVWRNEAYSWHAARLPVAKIVRLPEQTPPLYNVLLHFWVLAFGDSEVALRMPTAILGSLVVAGVYLLARRFLPERVALGGALLTAGSTYLVEMSQTARTNILFVLLTLLSYWFFVDLLEGRRARLGYVLSSAAMLYSHVFALFFLAAQAVTVLAVSWMRRGHGPAPAKAVASFIGLQALTGILFLPWVGILIDRVKAVSQHFWIQRPDVETLREIARALAGRNGGWLVLRLGVLLLFGLVAWGGWSLLRRRATKAPASPFSRKETAWLLGPWAVLPFALPIALSFVVAPFFETFSALPSWPAVYLLAACGVAALPQPALRQAAVVSLAVLFAFNLSTIYHGPRAEDWRSATAYLDAHARRGELVLFNEGVCGNSTEAFQCSFDYYTNRSDLRLVPFIDGYRDVGPAQRPDLERLVASETRLWVAYSDDHIPPVRDPHNVIANTLAASFHQDGNATFYRLRLMHWVRGDTP